MVRKNDGQSCAPLGFRGTSWLSAAVTAAPCSENALMHAVRHEHKETVVRLAKATDVNATDRHGWAPSLSCELRASVRLPVRA